MHIPRDLHVRRSWAAVVALSALVGAAVPALAGDAPGMVIYKDPATGQFMPPPANAGAQAPGAALTAPAPALVERPSPGGGYVADLQGRGTTSAVATKDAAGKLQVDCLHGEVK
jgi:hypothetical protein